MTDSDKASLAALAEAPAADGEKEIFDQLSEKMPLKVSPTVGTKAGEKQQ